MSGSHRVRFAVALAALIACGLAPAASGAVAVQIEGGDFTYCALTDAGGVKCWGLNGGGALGAGLQANYRARPVDVVGLTSGVTEIAGGGNHFCALTTSGGVKCWGSNFLGGLGDGTTTSRRVPVDVVGLSSGVAHIAAGDWHTCAIMIAGGVKCWGGNDYGQLGDGTVTMRREPVDTDDFLGTVLSLQLETFHSCALLASGSVQCWGLNGTYQLADGTNTDRHEPTLADEFPSDVSGISTGFTTTCALSAAEGVQCLGENHSGQLGAPGHAVVSSPVGVTGLASGVEQIDTGATHSCARMSSGGVRCWGSNIHGELGAFRADDHAGLGIRHRHAPATVPGLPADIAEVNLDVSITCARTDDGEVLCWGYNEFGSLGSGTASLIHRARPGYVLDFGASATTTTVRSSRRPARIGRVITYTARVRPGMTDLGRLRFTDRGRTIRGCGNVDVENGRAECVVRYLNPGLHRIRAHYLGSARLGASSSPVMLQRINP